MALDQADDALHESLGPHLGILLHRRKSRRHVGGEWHVVETHDANVIGYAQTGISQRSHRTDGDEVRAGKYGVEGLAAFEQLLGRTLPLVFGVIRGKLEFRVALDA